MATLGASWFDLIDLYKLQDETRAIAEVIELLRETNTMLDDAVAMECNSGLRHRTTIRTGLPALTWGQFYSGISQSKSTTAQVEDTTGFVEGLSAIDTRILDISNNESAVRLSEAISFLEAISQEVQDTLIYGNDATAPNEFLGLAPRFNDTSAANGNQIIDAGGSGADNTSIWFVTWSEQACHLIYPQGTTAGVAREDKGEQRVLDGSSDPYYVKEELFTQHVGLTVRDWRQVVRIANIDVSDMAAGSVDMFAQLRAAYWALKSHRVTGGRQVIYANADVLEALDAQTTPTVNTGATTTSGNIRLTPDEASGKEVMSYRGMPIRQVDAILNNEAQVT